MSWVAKLLGYDELELIKKLKNNENIKNINGGEFNVYTIDQLTRMDKNNK